MSIAPASPENTNLENTYNATSEGYEPNSSILLTNAMDSKNSEDNDLLDIFNHMEEIDQQNIFPKQPDATPTSSSTKEHRKETTTCTMCGIWNQQNDGFVLNGFPTCTICWPEAVKLLTSTPYEEMLKTLEEKS